MTGGVRSQFLADVFAHESHDAFWKAMSIRDKYAEMDVPALHVTGWFDDLSMETQTNFIGMSHHVEDGDREESGSVCSSDRGATAFRAFPMATGFSAT